MSSSSNQQGPRDLRSRRKEATRQEILAAAQDVFAEQGINEARMETIAARACVSVGTLYNYFDDRSALVHSLLQMHHSQLLEQLDVAIAANESQSFEARLQSFISTLILHIERKRILLTAVFADSGRNDGARSDGIKIDLERRDQQGMQASLMEQLYLRAETLCKAGVAENVLRADDQELYPVMLLGILRAMLFRFIFQPPGNDLHLGPEPAVRFFLNGASKTRGSKP